MRAAFLVLFVAGGACADDINDRVLGSYGGPANVINLFTSTGSFGAAAPISVPGWVSAQISPQQIQLRSLDGSVASPQWLQDFTTAGAGVTTIDFAWQSTIWNYATSSAGTVVYGAHQASAGLPFPSQLIAPSNSTSPVYFAAGGVAGFVAPVPEPSSVLIGALGAGLLGVRRWRRRRAAAPEPPAA